MSQNINLVDSIGLACEVVSAYVSNNSLPASELPALVASVHGALINLGSGARAAAEAAEPVVKPDSGKIRKSITPNGLISFEDGRSYKTLKRHLTKHGLTPERYREKWGLPTDYPMTAPSYSARRSELARNLGLGTAGNRRAA